MLNVQSLVALRLIWRMFYFVSCTIHVQYDTSYLYLVPFKYNRILLIMLSSSHSLLKAPHDSFYSMAMFLIRLLVNVNKGFTSWPTSSLIHSMAYLKTANDARIFWLSNTISSVFWKVLHLDHKVCLQVYSQIITYSQLCEIHQKCSLFWSSNLETKNYFNFV